MALPCAPLWKMWLVWGVYSPSVLTAWIWARWMCWLPPGIAVFLADTWCTPESRGRGEGRRPGSGVERFGMWKLDNSAPSWKPWPWLTRPDSTLSSPGYQPSPSFHNQLAVTRKQDNGKTKFRKLPIYFFRANHRLYIYFFLTFLQTLKMTQFREKYHRSDLKIFGLNLTNLLPPPPTLKLCNDRVNFKVVNDHRH